MIVAVAIAWAIVVFAGLFTAWIWGMIKVGELFEWGYPEWVQTMAVIIYIVVSIVILMFAIGFIGGKYL